MKKIIITEQQEQELIKQIVLQKTYPIKTNNVLLVKDYLDKNFKRGSLTEFGSNGMPTNTPVVGIISGGNVVKNLVAQQLLDILEDEFKGMFTDKIERAKFLAQVMIDWYYNRISKEGLLSVTHC